MTALTAGSTDTGCRHGQNSPCGTNIADDGWRKEQAGYSAANLSHCQSTGTCPTAQFSGHWRGLKLSSGGQSTAIAFLSTPGASCRVLGIIYVPAKRNGRQAPQGAYGPGGLKPCCSSRKHKDACFEYPRDSGPLNGRVPAADKFRGAERTESRCRRMFAFRLSEWRRKRPIYDFLGLHCFGRGAKRNAGCVREGRAKRNAPEELPPRISRHHNCNLLIYREKQVVRTAATVAAISSCKNMDGKCLLKVTGRTAAAAIRDHGSSGHQLL